MLFPLPGRLLLLLFNTAKIVRLQKLFLLQTLLLREEAGRLAMTASETLRLVAGLLPDADKPVPGLLRALSLL